MIQGLIRRNQERPERRGRSKSLTANELVLLIANGRRSPRRSSREESMSDVIVVIGAGQIGQAIAWHACC